MFVKRMLSLLLCLCLMVPAIGLQLASPTAVTAAAAAAETPYIVTEFGCTINGLYHANSGSLLIPGVGYQLADPLDLTQYGYSTDAAQNTLALQVDMYVSGDDGLVSLLERGNIGGQIEITSSGTCDQQERFAAPSALKFQRDTWVRRTLPLSSFTGTSGSEAFNPAAFNYFRLYFAKPSESVSGQKATIKMCNFRLVNTAAQAPSLQDDPIGDGTFAPKEAPQWKAVEFAEGMDASTPLVAGYNLAEYVKKNNVNLLDRHGNVDYAPAINSLLEGLSQAGGGTLFIPSGHYSCYSEIRIPRGVSICGDWASPEEDRAVKGTVIEVYAGHNETNSIPFIRMDSHTQVRNLTFWYPNQDAQNVVPYPPTIRTFQYTFVQNVTFVNSYYAVQQNEAANCPNVWNVYGTPLYKGLDIDVVIDIARLEEIHFAPEYWIESKLPGAPVSAAADTALRDYLYENGTAITLRRIDWSYLTYSDIRGYHTGLYFAKCAFSDAFPNGQCVGVNFTDCYNALLADNVSGSAESLADITIRNCVYGLHFPATSYGSYGSLQVTNVDIAATGAAVLQSNPVRVSMLSSTIRQGAIVSNRGHIMVADSDLLTPAPQVVLNSGVFSAILLGNRDADGKEITYVNQGGCPVSYSATDLDLDRYTSLTPQEAGTQVKGPAKANYYVANVDNSGATDVTEAIQALLTQAGQNGGGLVFLPPGKYRVDGALTVPSGVELRGAGDFGSMPAPVNTIILVYRRGGETDAATVTLEASAGIRAVTFHYPEQNSEYTPVTVNGVDSYRFTFESYPYAVRGTGSDVYVINVTSHNGYNGVDLATYRCDNHYVDYLAGHFFYRGIVVGGGSQNGVVRNYQFNYNAILNSHGSVWGDWGASPSNDMTAHFHVEMQRQFNNNAIPLVLGDVKNQLVYDCFNYSSLYGVLLTSENGNEPDGVRLYGHGVDYATEALRVEAGKNIEILNLQLTAFNQNGSNVTGEYAVTDKNIYDIHLTDTFSGEITIHNFTEWAPSPTAGVRVDNGTLNIYNAAMNHTSSQFFEMSSKGQVTVVGLSSGRSDTPVITDYSYRKRVTVIGGFYNTAFKVYRDYLGIYQREEDYTNGSYLHQWTGSYNATDAAAGFTYTTAENGVTITGYTGSSKTISIPAAIGGKPVVAIAAGAFSGKSLTAVALPETITTIGENAFSNCTALKGISIPEGVKTIAASAFQGCAALQQVSLPLSVTAVNANAFSGCTALAEVIYAGSSANREAIAVASGNTPLTAAAWTCMSCAHATTTRRDAQAAGKLTAGNTGDLVCTVCGSVVEKGTFLDPLGYAYLDTDGGAIATDLVVSAAGNGTTAVEALIDGEYGIPLTANRAGITLSGAMFRGIPANERVTLAIEYYITATMDGHQQMFRYQIDGYTPIDVYADVHALQSRESALLFHTFTAEERAVLGDEDVTISILGGADGAKNVYIQSVKVVPTSSLHIEGGNFAYADLRETSLCDFYSEITAAHARLMTWGNHERDEEKYPDEEWLYRYFKVYGAVLSDDATVNKPVYIKIYTMPGYENTTVSIDAFEVSDGTDADFSTLKGYKAPTITVTDGVGGVVLPEACFQNGLNGLGSLRFGFAEAPKIARIEIYDLQTACNDDVSVEVRAELHAWMLENGVNTTANAKGTLCATCNAVLKANAVYAKLDFSSGALVGTSATAAGYTVAQIPGSDSYGVKLYKQNQSFTFALDPATFGVDEADILAGEALAITYEYYMTNAWVTSGRLTLLGNGYNLGINGGGKSNTWDCLSVNSGTPLTRDKLDIISYTVGSGVMYEATTGGNIGNGVNAPAGALYDTVETAKALVNGKTFSIVCWNTDNQGTSGSEVYIKSITISKATDLQAPTKKAGSEGIYFDYATNPVHYPQYTKTISTGLTMTTGLAEYYAADTNKQYPRFNYGYVKVNELLSDGVTATDYLLRIRAKEGSDITQTIVQYQKAKTNTEAISGDERWSAYYTVNFVDGVATLTMPKTVFCNGLNAGASIRLRDTHYVQSGSSYVLQTNDDLSDIASIEVLPISCPHTQTRVEGAVAATCSRDGSTGKVLCADCDAVLQVEQVIAALGHTVVTDTAVAATCTANGLTAGKHCSVCDTVLVAQQTIPALGHTEVTDTAVAPTCTASGLTAGKHCSVCGVVLVAQQTIPALGHTPVVDAGNLPTCTNPGLTEGSHCDVCGATLTAQEVVDALGHTEVTDTAVAPTCTVSGLTAGKHCSVCGVVLTAQQTIPATGHTEVTDTAVAATCTASGLTAGKHCSVCGVVLTAQQTIPALGHTEVTDTAVAATCTASGLTAGKHCSVCGTVLVAQQTIPATGHTDGEWANKKVPTCTEEGYSGDRYCVTCGVQTVYGTVMAPTEHDEGVREGAYDATTSKPGYSGDLVCGVCGKVLEKGVYTPIIIRGELGSDGIYRENGKAVSYKGLIMVDGTYYYVGGNGRILKDISYALVTLNSYDKVDARIVKGRLYYFDANGRMMLGQTGIYGDMYYKDGIATGYAGMIEFEGELYYISDGARPVKGRYFISKLNGLVPSGGAYYFDENGAMVGTGVYDGYYYKNGKAAPYAGLIEFEGDYYYIIDNATYRKNQRFAPVTCNNFPKGNYYFGADGKALRNEVKDGFYYRPDGRCLAYQGLVLANDGYYYYVKDHGAVVKNNAKFYVTTTNGFVSKGFYAFDEQGRMILN